jgi:hypothetical protein
VAVAVFSGDDEYGAGGAFRVKEGWWLPVASLFASLQLDSIAGGAPGPGPGVFSIPDPRTSLLRTTI